MLRLRARAVLLLLASYPLASGCSQPAGPAVSAEGLVPPASAASDDELVAGAAALLAAIQAWPAGVGSEPICFAPGAYPYWFVDTDADGRCGSQEIVVENRYPSWNAALLVAASRYEGALSAQTNSLADIGPLIRDLDAAVQLLASCRPASSLPDCQVAAANTSAPAADVADEGVFARKPVFVGAAHRGPDGCPGCHGAEAGAPVSLAERCTVCHGDLDDPEAYRGPLLGDYDGDGDVAEPLRAELDGLAAEAERLLREASINLRAPLCRDLERYPHWFADLDGDGRCSEAETSATNPYQAWTGPMLRAAWALESHQRDSGAWAHDFRGMDTRLVEAIAGLGGDVEGLTRP